MFEQIVRDQEDDTASSPNAPYVVSAGLALAEYVRAGISGTPVKADAVQARQLYTHAATYFATPAPSSSWGACCWQARADARTRGRRSLAQALCPQGIMPRRKRCSAT